MTMFYTKEMIGEDFDRGVAKGATHMITVCDTFDNEFYPVYVMPGKDVREEMKEYDGKNMQEIMEVYNLKMDKIHQLQEHFAYHI